MVIKKVDFSIGEEFFTAGKLRLLQGAELNSPR